MISLVAYLSPLLYPQKLACLYLSVQTNNTAFPQAEPALPALYKYTVPKANMYANL